MDLLVILVLAALGAFILKTRDQHRRIALLGSHLGVYQIESLMESLTEGYLRALGEADAQRQGQIWDLLGASEMKLSDQFQRFALEFAKVPEADARVSRLAFALPYADKVFPAFTFDLRKALSLHAHGIANAARNSQQLNPKRKAYTLLAELMLMQHTCHWFCRSQAVASARLLTRHKTAYAQVLASVAPDTRQAYTALTGMGRGD